MKSKLLKLALPLGMGLSLFTITIMGLVSTTMVGCLKDDLTTSCDAGSCLGTDNHCYGPCTTGYHCTTYPSGNCSAPSLGGVYCCD